MRTRWRLAVQRDGMALRSRLSCSAGSLAAAPSSQLSHGPSSTHSTLRAPLLARFSLLRRSTATCVSGLCGSSPRGPVGAAAAPIAWQRAYQHPHSVFVRFQPTPNDACYKFYVDDMTFLPPQSHTMMFDSTNSYQSPLAHTLLEALPMVEEVTIGASFVTVRRVEEADAKAAARLFAMRFHGVQGAREMDEASAAARSQALQQHVSDALREGEHERGNAEPSHRPASGLAEGPFSPPTSPSGFAAEAPIEMGGFTVSPSAADEEIDEAALQALISATDWSELKLHVCALLTDHISSGSPHVDPSAPNPHADTVPEEGDSEVVLMIKELVATTIRPQLQDDGGDLRFVSFDKASGEMCVEMLGACRTCKSSKTTLVDLIERTTRHWIPEVKAVRDVSRVVPLHQRVAADQESEEEEGDEELMSASAMASVSQHPAVGEELVDDAGEEAPRKGCETVQFSSAVREGAAAGGYRIVREVKATAGGSVDAQAQ